MILHVDVVNKTATYRKRDGDIVCGNKDYKIKFSFDSEWDAHDKKIARFIWNGDHTDVELTGDTCDVPKITNATEVTVGVYAEEIATTTPAKIGCQLSILCLPTKPSEENERKYASEAQEAADKAAAQAAIADEAAEEAADKAAIADEAADRAEAAAARAEGAIYGVATAAEMDAILAGAQPDRVGTFYMYLGPTTDAYENGAIYRIEEE